MDEKALFAGFWEHEAKTTSKVLARIPEGSDYRPDPKSRTAQEIAWQIVCEEKMIIEALETGTVEWAPPPMPGTMKELCDIYDGRAPTSCSRWASLPAERWDGRPRVLRAATPAVADGVELPVRHRPPSRADHDLSAADGLDGAADLRPERRRAVSARAAVRGARSC